MKQDRIDEGDAFIRDFGAYREVHVVVGTRDDACNSMCVMYVKFDEHPDLEFTTYNANWNGWCYVNKWLNAGYTYLGGPDRAKRIEHE